MVKRKNEVALADADQNKSVREKYMKTDKSNVRTSSLFMPIMALEGHDGDIFATKFHPEGEYLASSGFDRKIFIWSVYGECENLGVLTGHSGAVLDMKFSTDGTLIYTSSTDMTVSFWDIYKGQRVKKLKGHTGFVNSCDSARRGPQMITSASDDCTIKVWDPRKRGGDAVTTFNNNYQVMSVCFNDTADQIITGGLDNEIKIWDLRKNALLHRLPGHTDTVTGLELSPDGCYLLSNAMDNSLRIWDVRPYAPADRCLKVFSGHTHNFEKNLLRCAWSPDGSKVSAGSADRYVYIWDANTRRILYKLPGHNGSVNDVDFHPKEPIIMSGSSDKVVYLGEFE
ncbi:U5 small nuclear ribonucleoprotein 40 kDa protein [Aphis craccivora]|uniref:U5 small nuclear ribonucleoprotein 40 kDa protein n=1 Tax=Aphis craccivora TaxID=307492 RepID=A0A6G0YP89_APHCR|nr:U5 small nuclear ribonucleoprotein 40 kDa protein [Aphis craccivora]